MPARADLRITVVVPAFQAAASVGEVVARTRASVPAARVIVVDDGSSDGTGSVAAAAGASVVRHDTNRGKGAALRSGVAQVATGQGGGGSVIVTLDSDGQHPPEEIPRLVAPIAEGQADLVLGARERTAAMPLGRRLTNRLSAALASRIGGQSIPDAQTGFRAFTAEIAALVRPPESHYEYEAAFLLEALARRVRVASIPIPTVYHGAPSHFRTVADTWRLARIFARYGPAILFGAT
ncbi:MAG TPA: glycosyltransferase family 2 protein [Gemmatimonadales bacterium]|nr:glycosyltransferase family 2 protein [Gemmatimonadales bacterium]